MYDRADGRMQAVPMQPEKVSLSPEKREGESRFKERFVMAMESAAECPELNQMFHKRREGRTIEGVLESEAFKAAFMEMNSFIDEGLEAYRQDDIVWPGRERLLRQACLLVSAPILLRSSIQGGDEASGQISKRGMSAVVYDFFSDVQTKQDKTIAITTQIETAYKHATGASDHPTAREAAWIAKQYPSTPHMTHNAGYDAGPYVSNRGREEKYNSQTVSAEQMKKLSGWLIPLLQEWKSAFNNKLTTYPDIVVLDFCDRYTKRYGEWPGVDLDQIESAHNEGRVIFEEDRATRDTHEYLRGEAEDLLKLFQQRQLKTMESLEQVCQRIFDAKTAILIWEMVLSGEMDKIDQRDVVRYASSAESLKANAVPFDGSPEWIAANQRLEFLNSFPQQVADDHELGMARINRQRQFRDHAIDAHNRALVGKKLWRDVVIDPAGAEIDQRREDRIAASEIENERYMAAMEAAEKAEKDLIALPIEEDKLEKRIARYKEAIAAQQEIVDEEQNAMNDWFRIYDESKYNKVPRPGKYIDELDRYDY